MCLNCKECAFKIPEVHSGFDIAYEIHITLCYSEAAIKYCEETGIKLINIDLGDKAPRQLMTSIQMISQTDKTVMTEVAKIKRNLARFRIRRTKIECSLNHPYAVETGKNVYDGSHYYEVHFAYEPSKTPSFWQAFRYGFHLSKNVMKTGTSEKRMLTKRFHNLTGSAQFLQEVEILKAIFKPDKVIMEYCLKDDEISLDTDWMNDDPIRNARDPFDMEISS